MGKKKELAYVQVWYNMRDLFESMTPVEAKQTVIGMIDYSQYGIMPDFGDNRAMQLAFIPIRNNIDAAHSHYAAVSERRSESGRKAHEDRHEEQMLPNAAKCRQMLPNVGDRTQSDASAANGMQVPAKQANTIQDITVQDRRVHDNAVDTPIAQQSIFMNPNEPIPMLLQDGAEWVLPDTAREECKRLYPAADINAVLRSMQTWLAQNPNKRRSADRMVSLVNTFLANDAKSAGKYKPSFGSMQNNQYDFDELERQLLAAQERDTAQK